MLTIPLYFVLFLYFACLVVFAIFTMFNFYHIVTTGSFTMASFIYTFLIFTLTVLTLYFTYQLLLDVDWKIALFNFDYNGFGIQNKPF